MDDPNDIILAIIIGWIAVAVLLALFLWRFGEARRDMDRRHMHEGATMREQADAEWRAEEWAAIDRELDELIRDVQS